MRDESWREWERRWEAAPGDQSVLQALITARRRAGLEIPGALLDEQVFPARPFESAQPWQVFCELPARLSRRVGQTPGDAVLIPRHRAWWVQPLESEALDAPGLTRAVVALVEEGIPGLSLRGAGLENHQLRPLRDARGLTRLSLEACARLTGPGLEHLAGLVGLEHLSLERCGRVTGGLRHLERTALRSANLVGCEWTPAGLTALEALSSLTRLRLSGSPIPAHTLHALAQLPQLARLELPRSQFEPRELGRLREAPALTALALPWSQVRDVDLALLAGCPRLRQLDLSSCRELSAVGVESLAGLESLRELRLYGCEQLGNKAVPALRQLTQLRRLDVSHTTLTKTRVAALRKALPECEVVASV